MLKKLMMTIAIFTISTSLFASERNDDTSAYSGFDDGQQDLSLQAHLNKNIDLRGEYEFLTPPTLEDLSKNLQSPFENGEVKLGLIFRIN